MSDPDLLYDTDFFAWTKDQAEALRAAKHVASPASSNRPLDWDNIAEEIEGLGKSQREALASQIRRILRHLIKLEFSSAEAPREGWRRSVREARVAVDIVLDANPSLQPEVDGLVAGQIRYAVRLALGDLAEHGEDSGEVRRAIVSRQYTPAEILSDWMPKAPHA